MDPNTVVLDISSDDDERRGSDGGDDSNWLTELPGDDSDDVVVVVNGSEKPVKKLKSSVVDSDDDECLVLEGDPNAVAEVRDDDDSGNGDDDSDDVVVVSEKGQVACRDYPHSRHLCIKFPFSSSPIQSHCNQCYCYVCDSHAPCVYWGNGSSSADHCHATDKDEFWILERKNAKNGVKSVQPVSQPPPVDLYIPPPVMIQPPNQIPKLSPSSHYRNNILAPRNQLHPDLVSRLVLRAQQKYNQGPTVHRPVFKRTHPVRAATTGHQNRYSSYRDNLGNPIRQNSYRVNGMLPGSSNYVGSLQQPNAVNASVPYPPQSQTFPPLTENQSNPSFQSHVNANPIPENPLYRVHVAPPLSSRPQPVSSQLTYAVSVQPSYHVQPKTQVDSPFVPVSDVNQNVSQASQSQGPMVDTGFKDYGLGLPTGQDSATNGSSLADYRFDWMFDNQPIEPGFTDHSSDCAFIDTGPIFDF